VADPWAPPREPWPPPRHMALPRRPGGWRRARPPACRPGSHRRRGRAVGGRGRGMRATCTARARRGRGQARASAARTPDPPTRAPQQLLRTAATARCWVGEARAGSPCSRASLAAICADHARRSSAPSLSHLGAPFSPSAPSFRGAGPPPARPTSCRRPLPRCAVLPGTCSFSADSSCRHPARGGRAVSPERPERPARGGYHGTSLLATSCSS
jgi:hypothetical protein